MAVYWALGKDLTKEQAKQEILAASLYQEENFSEYRDTSAQDTAQRIIKGYFGYENFELKKDIGADNIIQELAAGNLVIVPTNGQALSNPNFNPPGPERHMLVVIGYDYQTQEFITNDPGTRKGQSYRYAKDILFDAIRDYPTGYHEEIEEINKVMIVVFK